MRYRPFGSTEMAISAVSLALIDGHVRRDAAAWCNLVFEALEHGVNAFEVVGTDGAILEGLGKGIESIDRHLIFVALRLGSTSTGGQDFTAAGMVKQVEAALALSGIEYFDAILLNDPDEEALSSEALDALLSLKDLGATRRIGVAGEGPAMDQYISSGRFDVLATSYSLLSGWGTRNRIREAVDRNMAIIGYGFCPVQIGSPPERSFLPKKMFWGSKPDPVQNDEAGLYAFLHATPNWTAEEICLTFALTQPALATIQISSDNAHKLEDLARAVERELPPGLAPRIEMARFSGLPQQARA